jgi:hypothetical protein
MKLDDRWQKGFETFLHHWTSKVQELETITDKAIDDETKRIWLTNTLQGQKVVDIDVIWEKLTGSNKYEYSVQYIKLCNQYKY